MVEAEKKQVIPSAMKIEPVQQPPGPKIQAGPKQPNVRGSVGGALDSIGRLTAERDKRRMFGMIEYAIAAQGNVPKRVFRTPKEAREHSEERYESLSNAARMSRNLWPLGHG